MWNWLGRLLRGEPGRTVTLPTEASPSGTRPRTPRPVYDRSLRRTAEQWPGGGQPVAVAAPRLVGCRNWIYQLQAINWERIEASIADVAVVDASADGSEPARFPAGVIERMRSKPGGGDTVVLCSLSIGAAEPWRSYWSPKWRRSRPGWMDSAAGDWAGSQRVHYWDERWQALLLAAQDGLLARIQAAGFDGVVLDGIDSFEHFRAKGRQSAPDDMIELVARIGAAAWRSDPSFLVVPVNGEELLASARYRSVISAVIREDILYRPDYALGRDAVTANNPRIVAAAMQDLGHALADGIPVLAVEYLRDDPADAARIPAAARQLRGLGLVPYFAPRRLDRLCPAGD